ncbi:unnamed protein product [Danaus chrysippus]|uniref:(African queen) hypothetical protein n=1 Tax=Danaus chrysippus TaxID=151541 RepID=A0A8J2M981_9NEOP|nr:unnamed protein product [Danaus chrysippus]
MFVSSILDRSTYFYICDGLIGIFGSIKIQGATCDEVLIRQFLKVQRSSKGCIIDETQKEQIIGLLGDSAESIYEEARRIVGLLQKRQLAEE